MSKENAFEDFRNFAGISEAWELQRTGLVIIRDNLYRLELWHSYSNLDIPYYVSNNDQASALEFHVGDDALRQAMAFLVEGRAA